MFARLYGLDYVDTQPSFFERMIFMVYVGIDVSCNEHHCYIAKDSSFNDGTSFSFANNRSGFDELITKLSSFPKSEIVVGLEATGHYSNNLYFALSSAGFKLFCFNPLQAKEFAKGLSLRSTKTDKADAKMIAQMCRYKLQNPQLATSYHTSELKALTRHRNRLKEKHKGALLALNRCVYLCFPELIEHVANLNAKYILALLRQFPSSQEIAKASLDELTALLKEATRGRYGREKAEDLQGLAKESIGQFSLVEKLELRQTIDLLLLIKDQLTEVDQMIKEKMDMLNSVILTIPGISYTLGSCILAEIGDFSRFSSPGQILAYAGLDPKIYQSGKVKGDTGKMNKKGSRFLRYALIQAARLVKENDPTFNNYYAKKKAEGKHHLVALTHVARKLVRILFRIVPNQIPFVAQS